MDESEADLDREKVDLNENWQECMTAMDLFFNNEFENARKMMIKKADRSVYHSLGLGVIHFIDAMLSLDHFNIQQASETLDNSLSTIDKFRKKTSFGVSVLNFLSHPSSWINGGGHVEDYTVEEKHAELCHAECLLLKSFLTIFEDESLFAFVQAGMKIHECYKEEIRCWKVLNREVDDEEEVETESDSSRMHFASGVYLGHGGINLLLSLLPANVTRLLSFVGFSGNNGVGIRDLKKCCDISDGLRQNLASIFLLCYNLYFTVYSESCKFDSDLCASLLTGRLKKYPNSTLYAFIEGRFSVITDDYEKAKNSFEKACLLQSEWKVFHHICFWELFYIYIKEVNLDKAIKYIDILLRDSNWGKSILGYFKFSILIKKRKANSPKCKNGIEELSAKILRWKHEQRVAGKSLQLESFAKKRLSMYKRHGRIPAALIEYTYLAFHFPFTFKPSTENFFRESLSEILEELKSPLNCDNVEAQAYLNLLAGACYKRMNRPEIAKEYLLKTFEFRNRLHDTCYVIPYASTELASIHIKEGNNIEATTLLINAISTSKFDVESRLRIRMQSMLEAIQ